MADDDTDTGSTGGKTFTQAEVDKLIRDRLARERSKYADYDDLRARAAEADKGQSQLDKMQQQLDQMAQRAEKAEAAQLRAEVARELGLTDRQARRLSGSTRDEMLADGRDMLEDFAPKGGSKGGDGNDGNEDGKGETDDRQTGGKTSDTTDTGKQQTGNGSGRGRPQETLRSGAPRTESAPEETDPLKLAELIPRR